MKSLVLTLISLFIINSLCFSQSTTYPNGVTGCIARWDFASNGTVTSLPDVSGNNNNGTAYNLTTANGFRNIPNTAMKFDGFSSYAQVLTTPQLCPQQMTMIALVKFNGFYSGNCQGNSFICKGYDWSAGHYALNATDNFYDGDCSLSSPDYNQLSANFNSVNNSFAVPAGNYIVKDQWYFFAGSYDGSTIKFYQVLMDTMNHVNNVAPILTASNLNSSIGTTSVDAFIGYDPTPNFPYWLNGSMDEAAIFNKVLSDAEVQSVYDYLWGHNRVGVSVINKPNVSLYPNPSQGNITITGSISGNKADIEIVNGLGQVVYTRRSGINGQNINERISLPDNIPAGFYLLRLMSGDETSVLPFMLNR